MGSWFDVLMLFALIVFNGVFSMSEIALVTSRKARLQIMAEDGNKGAQRAVSLQADPTWALSTIQVGITSIGILSGIVGESALAGPAAEVLVGCFARNRQGTRRNSRGGVCDVFLDRARRTRSQTFGTKPPRGSRERRRPSASLAEPYHEPLREVAFVFHEVRLEGAAS